MSISFRDIIDLTVPHYLLITVFAPISAFMVINGSMPTVTLLPIIISISFGALGFNTLNMVFDEKIDRLMKPLRPIVTKKIKKNQAMLIGIFFYFIALVIAYSVNFSFFTTIVTFSLFTISYSSPWPYYKKYFWASAVCGAIVYGAIPFIGAYLVSSSPFPLHFFVFFTLIFFIISNSKDFEDMQGEKVLGINSIPVIFGPDNAAKLLIGSEFFLIVFTGYSALTGIIMHKFIYATLISGILFIPIAWLFWKDVQRIKYQDYAFESTRNKNLRNIITQSDGVTFSILFAIVIQLIFGLVAVAL